MSCRSATSGRLATQQRRMVSYDNTTVVHTYPIRRALFFSTRNLFLLAPCADAQIELFLPTNLTISAYPLLAGLLQDCCTAVRICYGSSPQPLRRTCHTLVCLPTVSISKTTKLCSLNLVLTTGESSIVFLVVLASFLINLATCRTSDRKKLTLAQLQKTCRTTDFLSDVRPSYDGICLSYDNKTVGVLYDRHSCRMSVCRTTENL